MKTARFLDVGPVEGRKASAYGNFLRRRMKLTRNGETNGSNRSLDHEIWIVFFKVMYVLMNLQIYMYNYLLVKSKQKLQTVRFTTHLISLGKIGPQCVLWVLCLILFLSAGMLFSNISIWELTRY